MILTLQCIMLLYVHVQIIEGSKCHRQRLHTRVDWTMFSHGTKVTIGLVSNW